MMMALLTFSHIFQVRRPGPQAASESESAAVPPVPPRITVDWLLVRRVVLAAMLTVMLAAITFLPIWAYHDRIGGHPDDGSAGPVVPIDYAFARFVTGDYASNAQYGGYELYYSFVMPVWFAVLLFIVLPPIRLFWKPTIAGGWRLWSVFGALFFIATIWGAGGTPPFVFLYKTIPLLAQWRYVGRALGVASFALSVLVAARIDGLQAAVGEWLDRLARRVGLLRSQPDARRALQVGLMLLILIVSAFGIMPVAGQWNTGVVPQPTDQMMGTCMAWLRENFPDQPLAAYAEDYPTVYPFFTNRIRFYHLTADFHTIPDPGTLYHRILFSTSLPRFVLAWSQNAVTYWRQQGYSLIAHSPDLGGNNPCLMQNTNAISYAYTIPLSTLTQRDQANVPLVSSDTTPIPPVTMTRYPDHIALMVAAQPDQAIVATIQEASYPGWKVEMDGQPAQLESIGGQVGVVIPPGLVVHDILFYFHPDLLYFGAVLTLLACLFSALYLLHVDRLLPAPLRPTTLARTALRVLLDTSIFEPRKPLH